VFYLYVSVSETQLIANSLFTIMLLKKNSPTNHFKSWLILFSVLFFSTNQPLWAETGISNFRFSDLNGSEHDFDEYRGKWVLVNYWASYCPPCLAEMPDIERFYRANRTKFTVLGMDTASSSVSDIKSFMQDYGITYPLIPTQTSTLLAFGEIVAIPTSYLISPQGKVVNKTIGMITFKDLDHYVNPSQSREVLFEKE